MSEPKPTKCDRCVCDDCATITCKRTRCAICNELALKTKCQFKKIKKGK